MLHIVLEAGLRLGKQVGRDAGELADGGGGRGALLYTQLRHDVPAIQDFVCSRPLS